MNLAEMLGADPAKVEIALKRLASDPKKLARVHRLAKGADDLLAQDQFSHLFPDADHVWRGARYHARSGYRAHLEFFAATADFQEVCFRAANRVGKSVAGGYATAVFATGRYPKWWEGRRFNGPVQAWAAGKTNETTRDIVQKILFGDVRGSGPTKRLSGTGIVPGDAIGKPSWKAGVADLVDVAPVRHVSGRWSEIGLKAYEQGRGAFEGTAKHVIWVDEEPPLDVYGEALVRLMTTAGLMLLTYTPLEGMSETTMQFEETI